MAEEVSGRPVKCERCGNFCVSYRGNRSLFDGARMYFFDTPTSYHINHIVRILSTTFLQCAHHGNTVLYL